LLEGAKKGKERESSYTPFLHEKKKKNGNTSTNGVATGRGEKERRRMPKKRE